MLAPSVDALPRRWSSLSLADALPLLSSSSLLQLHYTAGCHCVECSCIGFSRLGLFGGRSPLHFLAVCLCHRDFAGNPWITCESCVFSHFYLMKNMPMHAFEKNNHNNKEKEKNGSTLKRFVHL
jgi:hypothetical protein